MQKFINGDIIEDLEELELEELELEEEDIEEEELDEEEDKGFYKKNNIIIANLTKFTEYVRLKRITCLKLNNIKYKNILLVNLLIKNTQKNLFTKL